MDRREFLRSAAAPVVAFAPIKFTAYLASSAPLSTHALYDTRLGVLVQKWITTPDIADRCCLHAFDGDVTSVWRHALEQLWSVSTIATLGLTRHAEFFVLSTLAKVHGYRVAGVANHPDHVFWLLLPEGEHRLQ